MRKPPSDERGWSMPMIVLFLCFVLLSFQYFVRARFHRVTGLTLPAIGFPLKYQEGNQTPRRYIVYQTLPLAAQEMIAQGSRWAHPWKNGTFPARFYCTGRAYGLLTLQGNELMRPDEARWFLIEDDTVNEEGYLDRGSLVVVYPKCGRVYLFSYD